MRVERRPGHPNSYFFVAETEADKLFVSALRTSGRHAVDVHTILPDDLYDEFVHDPAKFNATIDGLEKIESIESCRLCKFPADRKGIHVCARHQQEYESKILHEVVEVELTVPCTCMLAEDGDPGFNKKTGHEFRCLKAAAIGQGLVPPDHRWKSAHPTEAVKQLP